METNYKITYATWSDVEKLTKNILKQIKQQNLQIDTLVPIIRGGMPLAMLMASNMENKFTSCIHIKRSKENISNSEFGKPHFKGITNSEKIKGKNIILLEDVLDTGLTLDFAINEVKKLKPKEIYVATLYNFNNNITQYKIISGRIMENHCWVVFPWEKELK